MARYKINRNKPEPDDVQIDRHKNFSKVLGDHQKVLKYKQATRPLYKDPRFMGIIVLLSVVLLLFVITEKEKDQTDKDKKPLALNQSGEEKTEVLPGTKTMGEAPTPRPIVQEKRSEESSLPSPAFEKFTFNPSEGTILYSGSTRILVPPSAFIDEAGRKIEKEVELEYRELRDPLSMYLAGIPMLYDSAGKEQLVSAGMFEIRAYAAGKKIHIGEPLTVEMVTHAHKNYNTYYYNEAKKKWEYEGMENKSLRFTIEADDKGYPELKPLKELVWEIVSPRPESYEFIFAQTWSQFLLDEKLKPNTASARLGPRDSEPKFLVRPVALTADVKLNQQIIDAKYKEYYAILKKKKEAEEKAQTAYQQWLNTKSGKQHLQWIESPEGQQQLLASTIVNVFRVNRFGIWNCDTPEKLPKGAAVQGDFRDNRGNKLEIRTVNMVDYSVNSLYAFNSGKPIHFNPRSENILWSALPDKKIAVFRKELFQNLPASGNARITMEVVDIKNKSEEEIREILGMNTPPQKTKREENLSGKKERILKMAK